MNSAHHLNELSLGFFFANDVVITQKVWRHGDQRVFRPATEPVDRAAWDQTGKL